MDGDSAECFAPMRLRRSKGIGPAWSCAVGRWHGRTMACARTGGQVEPIDQVGGGHVLAGQGSDGRGVGQAAGDQPAGHRGVAFGLRLGDRQLGVIADDAGDRAVPTLLGEELRRRIDLPGTHAEPQLDRSARAGAVRQHVASEGCATGAIGEQSGVEAKAWSGPGDEGIGNLCRQRVVVCTPTSRSAGVVDDQRFERNCLAASTAASR